MSDAGAIIAAAQAAVETGTATNLLPPVLEFRTLAELRAKVTAAGKRRWLLRGIWPAGDYGVHAAEMKGQKTWATVDLAVAVAGATRWLGTIDVDDPGAVIMFAGEGSEANLLRRIDAVARHHCIDAMDLPITICARAPHLTDITHLAAMAEQIDKTGPRLVTLDPLYLSARGAQGSSLYDMGAVLEAAQHLCADASASLWIVTHHNRKDGRGAARITGAGPAEWGRVLINATVISRHADPETAATTVITELDVIGGEIPDSGWRVTRRIGTDDPDDLDSPLNYSVHVRAVAPSAGDMPPARRKLLDALQAADGTPHTGSQLVDWIAAQHGHGLTRETCSRELNALAARGQADRIDHGHGRAAEWFVREEDGKNP
jgi:hypothetical protein